MIFNSFEFAVFFAAVFPIYWLLRLRAQNLFLIAASYLFYGWWDWRFLFLLAGTTLIDFWAVRRIGAAGDDERRRRGWMIFSVAINLAVLGFFKYFDFFIESGASTLSKLGIEWSEPALRFALPVGISFYVFHEISYAVDVYRRRVEPETDLVVYALYIAFFPQLVAGPITRAGHMLPQFRRARTFPDADERYSAFVLVLSGLFKKVVLADGLAGAVNEIFGSPDDRGLLPLLVAMFAFSVQIYGDFAGYTDIARGLARFLGIEIARNFEQPYLARNITEFWRHWHMSLSSWLHDYLYVPLGGNRGGKWATYRNLMIVMLLGGLWHGASWHFVVWGGLHGAALALHRAFGRDVDRGRAELPSWRDVPAIAANFVFVSVLWVFFRADSFADALDFFGGMTAGLTGPAAGAWKPVAVTLAVFLPIMLAIDLLDRGRIQLAPLRRVPALAQGALAGAAIVALIVYSGGAPEPFIYFQF